MCECDGVISQVIITPLLLLSPQTKIISKIQFLVFACRSLCFGLVWLLRRETRKFGKIEVSSLLGNDPRHGYGIDADAVDPNTICESDLAVAALCVVVVTEN